MWLKANYKTIELFLPEISKRSNLNAIHTTLAGKGRPGRYHTKIFPWMSTRMQGLEVGSKEILSKFFAEWCFLSNSEKQS